MATYTVIGNSHKIIYPYRTETGERKQQWETYETELEATLRKVVIGHYQEERNQEALRAAVKEYRDKKAKEKSLEQTNEHVEFPKAETFQNTDNYDKTYQDFVDKWLPVYTKKNRLAPNSYDSIETNLRNHILPFFGQKIMSQITSQDIDDFIIYLTNKVCKGSKSYNKKPGEIETLASSSIKRCYTIFTSGFPMAKKWKYIKEIPESDAPTQSYNKRKWMTPEQIMELLECIEDKTFHLAVHLAFVCSLRAGETAGIELRTINFRQRKFEITQTVQRVSDKALSLIPKSDIIHVFPKCNSTSKTSLITKLPKTKKSVRSQYMTIPLMEEIRERMADIEDNKQLLGQEYHDYGLLICQMHGRPFDPKDFNAKLKKWETKLGITQENQIEFQGLRKSGQMHKVRLTKNNYQLVAENGGQSPKVLMDHYNEVLEDEKRNLADLAERNFYQSNGSNNETIEGQDAYMIVKALQKNPNLMTQLAQLLTFPAAKVG